MVKSSGYSLFQETILQLFLGSMARQSKGSSAVTVIFNSTYIRLLPFSLAPFLKISKAVSLNFTINPLKSEP